MTWGDITDDTLVICSYRIMSDALLGEAVISLGVLEVSDKDEWFHLTGNEAVGGARVHLRLQLNNKDA